MNVENRDGLFVGIDVEGTIRYFNESGSFHRKNGPAVECSIS